MLNLNKCDDILATFDYFDINSGETYRICTIKRIFGNVIINDCINDCINALGLNIEYSSDVLTQLQVIILILVNVVMVMVMHIFQLNPLTH